MHNQKHSIASSNDHTAGQYKILWSNGDGEVTEISHSASGKYLRSGLSGATPDWANIDANNAVTCAGATPVISDFSSIEDMASGFATGTGGRIFRYYKVGVSEIYAYELTTVPA